MKSRPERSTISGSSRSRARASSSAGAASSSSSPRSASTRHRPCADVVKEKTSAAGTLIRRPLSHTGSSRLDRRSAARAPKRTPGCQQPTERIDKEREVDLRNLPGGLDSSVGRAIPRARLRLGGHEAPFCSAGGGGGGCPREAREGDGESRGGPEGEHAEVAPDDA